METKLLVLEKNINQNILNNDGRTINIVKQLNSIRDNIDCSNFKVIEVDSIKPEIDLSKFTFPAKLVGSIELQNSKSTDVVLDEFELKYEQSFKADPADPLTFFNLIDNLKSKFNFLLINARPFFIYCFKNFALFEELNSKGIRANSNIKAESK
jgi:hypothetical protein